MFLSTVEENLARSLTADTTELITYLPYLLQDIWELGSQPAIVDALLSKHIALTNKTRILDLACGKGAVSIALAKAHGCEIKGIDLMPEFIAYAIKKAKVLNIANRCEFIIEDINVSVEKQKGFDIVILGAVGDVLGDRDETFKKLKKTLCKGGFIILDEAYAKEPNHKVYVSKSQWSQSFDLAELDVIEEISGDEMDLTIINQRNQAFIIQRTNELKALVPSKADLFEQYVQMQQAECDEMENDLNCVTWLLRMRQ